MSHFPSLKDRPAKLAELRNVKMARSAHAYVRGNTQKFYHWLDESSIDVPQGPAVWICGDCHVGNLGPIANAKGKTEIQIRDLDQSVIGNPAYDLIRLGLSLACAARGSDLPGITTARMLEQIMEGYLQSFSNDAVDIERPEVVEHAIKQAMKRKWKHLAKERIEDTKPEIPLGKHFWPLSKKEKHAIAVLFEQENVRRLLTKLRSRDDDASVTMLDAAYWIKGCSSLGKLRYAVLVEVDGDMCIIDIKEAVQTVTPRAPKAKMPKNNAERVVEGAWHLAPALGDRILAAELDGHAVFLRELLPQDMKFEIEQLTVEEAVKVAGYLAMVLGKAHARQMNVDQRKAWQDELKRNRSKTLDAPSWLWSSVVEQITHHEGAYLEHCRKHALSSATEK